MKLKLIIFLLITSCFLPGCGGDSTIVKERMIGVDPEVIQLPEQHYLVFRQELPLDNMTGFFGIESQALLDAAQAAGIEATGPISGLFYNWDTEAGIGDAAVALPVAPSTQLKGYVNISLPATRAFAAEFVGPYTSLGAIHYALEAQFTLQQLKPAIPSIEQYLQGPTDKVTEDKFRTRVIYPIAE